MHDRLRLMRDAAVGEADGAQAGGLERDVAAAVRFEARSRPVVLERVELDDEAVVGPVGVDLVTADVRVRPRRGSPAASTSARNAASSSERVNACTSSARLGWRRRAEVTVIFAAAVLRSPCSSAAERWLSTAPSPAASVAAMYFPLRESSGCPTA